MHFKYLLKRKRLITAGLSHLVFTLVVFAALLTSCGRNQEAGQEVISRRVKLDMPDSGEQQAKTDARPAVENMPDVKADLPVKDVAKPDMAMPAIKVEIPEKKVEPNITKGIKTGQDTNINGKETKKPAKAIPGTEKSSVDLATAGENSSERASKKVYPKSVLKKAKLKPWAVNVASYPSETEAKKLISVLKAAGYSGYMTEFTKNGVKWHRVRVGFYHTREEALKTGKRIETRFHVSYAWVVQPPREEALEHIK